MYLTVRGVNITPTVFPGTPIWALGETQTHMQKVIVSLKLHAHTYTKTSSPIKTKISSPDVGTDVHFAALQRRVHGQVDGVGGLAAVVLVDEHRVFSDIKACGIPVKICINMEEPIPLYFRH